MKLILSALVLSLSFSAFSQRKTVTATLSNEDAFTCFYKQVELSGYMYANVIGHCGDSNTNWMQLFVVAVSENFQNEEAHRVFLGNFKSVDKVENKQKQLQISVSEDSYNSKGKQVTVRKTVYLKSLNPKNATFSTNTIPQNK